MKTFADQIKSPTQLRHSFCSRMLMTTTCALVFVMIGLPQAASAAPIPITTCPALITSPGAYRLDVDCLVGPDVDAIVIAASDVRLNLNGHTISGPISTASDDCLVGGNGIYIGGLNVHVSNGVVIRFRVGIITQSPYHDNQANNLIVTGNCVGIVVHFSDNNRIKDNNVSGNLQVGVFLVNANNTRVSNNVVNNTWGFAGGTHSILLANSNDNVINGNDIIASNPAMGIRLITSHNNVIRNNRAIGNYGHEGIRIDGDGSSGNLIQANTAVFNQTDLADYNLTLAPLTCLNTWTHNTFVTDNEVGAGAGCIQ